MPSPVWVAWQRTLRVPCDISRNKVGAPFRYTELLFATLAVVKSMTGLPYRCLEEIVFPAFKRMFGGHLYSLKWKNMVQEVQIKVATYNRRVDMGAGAV